VIFANTKKKDRSGVVHYFFPAERNLMVEVVPGADTSPATKAWLLSFYESDRQGADPVKSRYGYALDPVFEGLFFACALLADRRRHDRSRSTSSARRRSRWASARSPR
jgi:3-hydroxyacyl-CoA dehydrogenase